MFTFLDTIFYVIGYFYVWVVLPVGFFASLYYLSYQPAPWRLISLGLAGACVVPTVCGLWPLGPLKALCLGAEMGIAYGTCLDGSARRRIVALMGWLLTLIWLGYEYLSNDIYFWQPVGLHLKRGQLQFGLNLIFTDIVFVGILGALAGSVIGSQIDKKLTRQRKI